MCWSWSWGSKRYLYFCFLRRCTSLSSSFAARRLHRFKASFFSRLLVVRVLLFLRICGWKVADASGKYTRDSISHWCKDCPKLCECPLVLGVITIVVRFVLLLHIVASYCSFGGGQAGTGGLRRTREMNAPRWDFFLLLLTKIRMMQKGIGIYPESVVGVVLNASKSVLLAGQGASPLHMNASPDTICHVSSNCVYFSSRWNH